MNAWLQILRGLIFDNLGLKFVALLLAILIYVNVYTDREQVALVSFPVRLTGLDDTLSFSGPVPAAVQAELRGTGKQLIRLRLQEPTLDQQNDLGATVLPIHACRNRRRQQ